MDANANPGTDTITFAIPGAGVHTIQPLSSLPAATDPVVIDGTTQPGFAGTPTVELRGPGVNAPGPSVVGLTLSGGSSVVRGLTINSFNSDGLLLTGPGGDVVAGNFIGTDQTGTTHAPNWVAITSHAPGETIGGPTPAERNVISGNQFGVTVRGDNTLVQGNYIGADATGSAPLGNGYAPGASLSNFGALLIQSSNAVITGNVVSATQQLGVGILLNGNGVRNTTIRGNLIGLDASGSHALGTQFRGIQIVGSSNNTIGGTTPDAGNIISGNTSGIEFLSQFNGTTEIAPTGNVVIGNRIGTTAGGNAAIPNFAGIVIAGGTDNTIGGTSPASANVISGNSSYGILFSGPNVKPNNVHGNLIGVGADRTTALGNSTAGVQVMNSASAGTIGGVGTGQANVIAWNGHGIRVAANASIKVRGNAIFANHPGLGIDLGYDTTPGVTPNDAGDADGFQNFPVLTSVSSAAGGVHVTGTLDSFPSKTYELEFFGNASCDPSGYGQGEVYLGSATVATGADGSALFAVDLAAPNIATGNALSATATDPAGNTSEFSQCATLLPNDSTSPALTPTVVGTLGANGWYTSDVHVSWSATDPESAITSSSGCGSTSVTTDTGGVTFTCTATSAGGTTTQSLTVKRDTLAPSVTAPLERTPDHDDWYNHAVGWSGSGSDTNGIASCTSGTYSGPDSETATVAATCTDAAGNVGSSSATFKYDATAPTVSPSVSPNPVLRGAIASATAGAHDNLSGIDSSSCGQVDTSAAGSTFSVTCSATDKAGNTNTASASYSVLLGFDGFFAPVDMNMLNIVKAGRAVPLLFNVYDTNGPVSNLSGANVTVTSQAINCLSLSESPDELEEYASGGSGLQNLGGGAYQFNWKTPKTYAGSCQRVHLHVGDGLSHTADFQFTK
jgi:hypothetical protein